MLPYLSAVTPQIAFTHSVREFIRELLKRFIPGKWIDRVISEDETSFDAKLDAVLVGLDEKTATSKDYCAKVVSALCDEVSSICEVTRLVCINRGYEEYAATYLSSEKFVKLLLRQDRERLKRLNALLEDKAKPLCVLLQEIGAVLEDRPTNEVAAFGASELRKANAELKAIAVDVKKTLQDGVTNIRNDIAVIGEKMTRIKYAKRGRKRRHGDDKTEYCQAVLAAAKKNTKLKFGLNTRLTHKAVFDYYRKELAELGVAEVSEFTRIIRAHQAREQRVRDKDLEAHKPRP